MQSTAAGHDIPTSTTPTERQCRIVFAPEHLTTARAYAPSTAPQRKKLKPVTKTSLGKQLPKSLSTPQLRGPIMSDSEAQKRNKLGYQRISIACAHCRRRKIRCLLTEDENEQRCQNCIRLKKECVFYPVDQQAAMDARSEASSKTGGPSASSTVSSSPSQISSRNLEQSNHHLNTGFQHPLPDGSRTYQPGIPIVPSLTIPPQADFAQPDHGFQSRPEEMAVAWSPQGYPSQSPAAPMTDTGHIPQHFVGYGQPNVSVDTAPYPGTMDQSQQNLEQFGYSTGQIVPQQWHPQSQPQQQHQPVRSMSYPNNYAEHMYSPPFQQGQPSSPYVQVPPFQHHQTNPQMVGMTPNQGSFGGTPNYMMQPDHRSSSIPNPSPFQTPQQVQAWYSGAPSYATATQEMRTLPSQNDEGGFPGRPG